MLFWLIWLALFFVSLLFPFFEDAALVLEAAGLCMVYYYMIIYR